MAPKKHKHGNKSNNTSNSPSKSNNDAAVAGMAATSAKESETVEEEHSPIVEQPMTESKAEKVEVSEEEKARKRAEIIANLKKAQDEAAAKEAEERAAKEAEELAQKRAEIEANVKKALQEAAEKEAEAKKEAEEKAKKEAEEKAKKEAEEKAKKEAEEKAKKEAEEKAKKEAEEKELSKSARRARVADTTAEPEHTYVERIKSPRRTNEPKDVDALLSEKHAHVDIDAASPHGFVQRVPTPANSTSNAEATQLTSTEINEASTAMEAIVSNSSINNENIDDECAEITAAKDSEEDDVVRPSPLRTKTPNSDYNPDNAPSSSALKKSRESKDDFGSPSNPESKENKPSGNTSLIFGTVVAAAALAVVFLKLRK